MTLSLMGHGVTRSISSLMLPAPSHPAILQMAGYALAGFDAPTRAILRILQWDIIGKAENRTGMIPKAPACLAIDVQAPGRPMPVLELDRAAIPTGMWSFFGNHDGMR